MGPLASMNAARIVPPSVLAGLAGVLIGAQLLVVNASTIATSMGVSQIIIGFTAAAPGFGRGRPADIRLFGLTR